MTPAPVEDHQEDAPADDELDPAATARKLAGYLIVAGCVIAVACIGFIVWEQWRANRAALASADDPSSATLYPVANGAVRHPAPDPGPQDLESDPAGPETDRTPAEEG